MPRQALLDEIDSKASALLQGHEALEKSTGLLELIYGKLTSEDITKLLRLAERIRINTLKDNDDLYNLNDCIDLKLQDLVASDYLVENISFWVEKIREEHFGSTEPPFPDDLESALSWVESSVRIDLDEHNRGASSDSANKNKDEITDRAQANIPFLKRDIFMPSNNRIKSLWVQPGTLLYHLSRKIENIASATGFKKHALTVYILTGLEPILPRITVHINPGRANLPVRVDESGSDSNKSQTKMLSKKSLKVEIHSADLSPAELKMIYDRYRGELGIRKSKSLSTDQVKLFYLVINRGGPPEIGSKAFWQSVREEWNSEPNNKSYSSWEGVYQRYKIVEKKMEALFLKTT